MSELTTAILVHNLELSVLNQWICKKKKDAYLTQINPNWVALFIENDLRSADKWAGKAAVELKTEVLFFGNYDEWGWRADFWEDGVLKIHIDVPFHKPKKIKLEPLHMEAWIPFAVNREPLDLLNALLQSTPLNPEGVDYLTQAFALESLTFLSFDNLSMLDDSLLEEKGIHAVQGNTKKLRINEIILDVIREPLEQLGYILLPAVEGGYSETGVIFYKMIDSYRYLINLSRSEDILSKRIQLYYIPPYYTHDTHVWMDENGYEPIYKYGNESELRASLQDILQHIITKGIPWLESQRIDPINVEEVYNSILSPYMNEHGFYLREEEKSADSDIDKKEFIYQTPDQKWRILFQHKKNYPEVYIYMKRYDEMINSSLYDPDSGKTIDGGTFPYKTSQELGEQLIVAAKGFFNLMQYEPTLKYSTNLRGTSF